MRSLTSKMADASISAVKMEFQTLDSRHGGSETSCLHTSQRAPFTSRQSASRAGRQDLADRVETWGRVQWSRPHHEDNQDQYEHIERYQYLDSRQGMSMTQETNIHVLACMEVARSAEAKASKT